MAGGVSATPGQGRDPGREAARDAGRETDRDAGRVVGRVAVTGSSGKLGRAVVAHLAEAGWQVRALDRVPPRRTAGAGDDVAPTVIEFVGVELTDYGQVLATLSGGVDEHNGPVDAVVHLAAVPAAGLLPNATTFANNATATYNVFAAARALRVRNVVWASSETVLGLPFDTPPPYVPVDEDYPPRPESTYALTKTLEEEMARQLCRWDPQLKMVGLRFSNVMEPHDYAAFPGFDADPMTRKWNLWGYIDARDGAQAVRLALEYPQPGTEVFIVANADTVMSRRSGDLVAEVFPGVEVRKELGDHETLLSIDKARRLLGFEPAYSWRDGVG